MDIEGQILGILTWPHSSALSSTANEDTVWIKGCAKGEDLIDNLL